MKYLDKDPIKSFLYFYTKMSNWGKVLFFASLLLILIVFFKNFKMPTKEGFEQNDSFLLKSGNDVYDDFYSQIYTDLVYSSVKDNYEVGEIVNSTRPTNESIILDVGCGTGNHVSMFATQGYKVKGIDISTSMIRKAQENYPQYDFVIGDIRNASEFTNDSFTHILCLYFTLYYMKDKSVFFNNCMNWLMPGGYLVVHVVDREKFDPIIPPANPLMMVSPQRYAKKRITSSKVTFNDMDYHADFQLDGNTNIAIFSEKFKNKDNEKIRKNEHVLYMESEADIVNMAQNAGFIIQGKIDMVKCSYEYQYLYVFLKPA